jgi:mono/diheme cytochrome c family protein
MDSYLAKPGMGEAWDWYMYRPHGYDMLPVVLVKLLPELDSGIWGKPNEKFSRFGHFVLPGDENRPLPSSMGVGGFPSSSNPNPLLVTTETCGTCHMGRVRISDDADPNSGLLVLFGGINRQMDVRRWKTALEQTVARYLATPQKIQATAKQLRQIANAKPAKFFHENADEDQRQRMYFAKAGAAENMLRQLVDWTEKFTTQKKRQLDTSYGRSNSPSIEFGHPGQVDASGDLLGQRLHSQIGMPENASLTDIPSTWRQDEYSTGQWDGSVTNQFIRNLAAQVAVVPGPKVDRRVAEFSRQFMMQLPSPPYPFAESDGSKALVQKGKALFDQNCADCHKPLSSKTYHILGTDPNRANVMTKVGGVAIAKIFYDACHAKLPDGTDGPSCGNFMKYLGGPDPRAPRGYHAKPLAGIWARAPYFHNGSVPTLRHLLEPKTRPPRFVVGTLGYDTKNVGFHWDIEQFERYAMADPLARDFDTTQDGLSNKGHDQASLTVDGKTYRLDWSYRKGDDPEALESLLSYLKTL